MSKFQTLHDLVIDWAEERGIFDKATPLAQIEKTREEVEETRDALVRIDENSRSELSWSQRRIELEREVADGIGDTVVTLIILAHLCGTDIEECLELAYNEIKDRKGKMVDGVFVKEGGSK